MNKVILLALLMPFPVFSQITDDFESGDISRWIQSPENHWKADTENSVSGVFSLHHSFDNPESGYDLIGLSLQNLRPADGTTSWNFKIRYGYDPSSSNNWVVFLMSESDPAESQEAEARTGYAVGVNQNSYDDTLRLWKVVQGQFITLISSKINWQTEIETSMNAALTVSRSKGGDWVMSISDGQGRLLDTSSGSDPELFKPSWFIICYRYSSLRDMQLWFDDLSISGIFREGPDPPELFKAGPGDVVITELMAKPQPSVSLPPMEFMRYAIQRNLTSGWMDGNWQLQARNILSLFQKLREVLT